MNTYRAYVRVPFGDSTTVVETAVQAQNTNAANFSAARYVRARKRCQHSQSS